MKDMVIDVDGAYEHYCNTKGKITKSKFLELIGMNWATAGNFQSSKSKQVALQYAQKIKEVTGLSLDKIIKPKQ